MTALLLKIIVLLQCYLYNKTINFFLTIVLKKEDI